MRLKPWQTPALIALILAILAVTMFALAWVNRAVVAREILVGWLQRRGIEASVEIERLELDGVVARVRIGDAAAPDVTVERVEVDYAVAWPWAAEGLGLTPSRIRLVRPIARARWRDGRLSFGSLDPLIEEYSRRPPRADRRGPLVVVENGRLRLGTDYGPVSLLADATVDDGRLVALSAQMPTASLKSGAVEARGLGGSLSLTTRGDRLSARWLVEAERFTMADRSGQGIRLAGTAALPYPDFDARRGDGLASTSLVLTGDRLDLGQGGVTSARLTLAASGSATGWIETLGFNGRVTGRLTAATLEAPGLSTRRADLTTTDARLSLVRTAGGIDWALNGPSRGSASSVQTGDLILGGLSLSSSDLALSASNGQLYAIGPLVARLDAARFDDVSLSALRGRLVLDYAADRPGALVLTGSASADRGAWPLFGRIGSDDVPELAQMKRALSAFALSMPAFRLSAGESGTALSLLEPARLTPANGGVLTASPSPGPIFAARRGERGGGSLTLSSERGQGLPEARFAVPQWRLTPGGFRASLEGQAALDFGLARGLSLETRGVLATERGRLTYVADACAPFAAERLELDQNDVVGLTGRLCPSAEPLLVSKDGRWTANGRIEGTAAAVPFLAVSVEDAQGQVTATGSAMGLGLQARIAAARIDDATRPRRFNLLTTTGTVALAEDRWSGVFDLARNATTLGRLTLVHDGRSGQGGVGIEAPELIFQDGALQPADLSPLVAGVVQSPARGSAAFTGRIDWSEALPDGGSSSGRLVIPALDFTSPAGPVKGLSGTLDFVNLAPLITAPGQTLRIRTLESITDLTDLDLTFALDKAAISVAGGAIRAAGGTLSIEPFSVPLDRRPFSGVIVLDRVQLGELIAGAGFDDQVQLDAVVSGRLPFTSDPDRGVTIAGGRLYAAQPGRLSIRREALSDLEAGGGGAVPPGTVQDLAYQAMENLAFDVLTAEVNSLDQGRVGVLFRIVGRHDPPNRQELRLSLAELISREFLNRPLPLPSDTGIDLTLDTTLNLNQLVSDLLAINRARNGAPEAEQP